MEKVRIFIVEDEALVAKDIESSLKDMGFAVLGTASSGEKAIIKVGENRPDLVLMDIKLKGKMNGIETASEIKARFNIPSIYLTAHADEKLFQSAKLTQPFGYIIKPFEERELARTIDMALYRHKMELKAKWDSDVNKSLARLYKPLISPTASMVEISDVVLDSARKLTGSAQGFVGTIHPDTGDMVSHTLSEMMKDKCKIKDKDNKITFPRGEDGLYPGLWGYALNKKAPFFTNEAQDHPAAKGLPNGHLPIYRFLSVPVMVEEEPVGQIALSGKDVDYTEDDLKAIVRVAEFHALAIQKIAAKKALQEAHDELEKRVRERTADLLASNAELKNEIDIRVKAENLLRDNQKVLRAFLDSIPNPAFLVGISGTVVMANKAFQENLGTAGEPIIGAALDGFLSLETMEKREVAVDEVIRKKEPRDFEMMDGQKTVHHYIYPVFDSRGEVTRLANLCFDVTLQKQMERQFVQHEKLAALGFLVSGVAHEINNPNNFISFNIPILRDYLHELTPIIDRYADLHPDFEPFGMPYPEFREDLFKILDNMERGSHRINITVSELRDFSRKKEKIALVPVDIKDVIQKAVSISKGKLSRMVKTLTVSVPEDMPIIHTDPDTLEHILINLLINGAQACDKEDSSVAIIAKQGDDSRFPSFIIEVKDNGCGMDKETTAKIFDPFFTTKAQGEGTGLGLTLCHNLATALRGRMEVESEPGKGSAFRLVLPGEEL